MELLQGTGSCRGVEVTKSRMSSFVRLAPDGAPVALATPELVFDPAFAALDEASRCPEKVLEVRSTSRSRYGSTDSDTQSQLNLRCNFGFNRLSSAK